jgi:lysozyme
MAKGRRKKKGKNTRNIIIVSAIVAALAMYIFVVYTAQKKEKASHFALYPDFAIEIPLGYKIHGIDVSSYQGNIYWPAVAEMRDQDVQIKFAFIKATEGLINVDKQFRRNWQKAKEANITQGSISFFPGNKSGRMQAQNFIKNVKLQPGDLPRCSMLKNCMAFRLTVCEAAYVCGCKQ